MLQIKLLPGIFETSQIVGKSYLEYLEVDRLVAPCYEAIGLTPKAKRYGGWEERAISGHSLGHFLSAGSFMVNATDDRQLKEKLYYAVDELAYLQSQDKEGYVSGFPKDCFNQVFSGTFEVERFSLGHSWVPWYSIHKIFAGLVDVYQNTGYIKALEVVIKLSDWAKRGTDHLNDEEFEQMLYCEFGGMNEVMAALYELTGNQDYLQLAKRFCHKEALDDLSKGIDNLEGKHANTQIPKVLGAAKLYAITGEDKYKAISSFFWEEVVGHRSYVIGGNSRGEHFGKTHTEPLGVSTAETCNTYNMLKLSAYLFEAEQDSKYMDYYEKALYNHILASQDPDSGMKTYFMSTEPGHFKIYCEPEDSFWCCTGSGMENPARYHQNIYTLKDQTLFTNLYIASHYINTELSLEVKQETRFPYGPSSQIELLQAPMGSFTLAFRMPSYLKQPFELLVNGEKVVGMIEKGYMYVNRLWQKGDIIGIGLPMALSISKAMGDDTKVSFLYGPIVLAGALGITDFPERDLQKDHIPLLSHPGINVPVLVTDESDLTRLIQPVEGRNLHFKTDAIGQPGAQSMNLMPFFELHHQRYTLYFRCLSLEQYEKVALTSPSYQEKLHKVTIDTVVPNEQQPEVDHHIRAIQSNSGYSTEAGSGWREAQKGGYFSYKMKVLNNALNFLCVTYWGSDTDIWSPDGILERRFDIVIEGSVIATEVLKEKNTSMLYDVFYEIPITLTNAKETVTVSFQSDEKTIAGRVFGVKVTRASLS